MIWLHAGDHAELGEPRDILGGNVLGVLDAKPPIARSVELCHALEYVQLQSNGAVAYRMHRHLQPSGIRSRRPGF